MNPTSISIIPVKQTSQATQNIPLAVVEELTSDFEKMVSEKDDLILELQAELETLMTLKNILLSQIDLFQALTK